MNSTKNRSQECAEPVILDEGLSKPRSRFIKRVVGHFRGAIFGAALVALTSHSYGASSVIIGSSSSVSNNVIVQWNRALLVIVRTHGAQPATIHSTRSFAMLHAAMYDAVNSIDRTHQAYAINVMRVPLPASEDAAAAAAAHEVLSQLYPSFQLMLDAQLQQSLSTIPANDAETNGFNLGLGVAHLLLDLRSNDGSGAAQPVYTFGTAPGDYQSTPPNFPLQPQFTQWPEVTPFILERANQFRPGPPPALSSKAYSDAFNEVKTFGIQNGTASSADQALTGTFWNGAIQDYWNEIAQTAALEKGLNTAQSARIFALLNLAMADGVIAFYDAKYTYNFWRPITAIRAAEISINPETTPDPTWLPEVGNTTPDPSYPGAHAALSAAASAVLESVLHDDKFQYTVTSEVMPGVERSFDSFSAAAEEATMSRIFAGVHFRTDLTAGTTLGRNVADFALAHFLLQSR